MNEKKPIEIEDILHYTFYGNLQQQGNNLVFTAARAHESENRYRFWLMKKCGDGPIESLTSFGSESAFFFQDENIVLFCGNREKREKKTCIYKIHLNGGEAQEIACLDVDNAAIKDRVKDCLILQVTKDLDPQETDYEVLDEVPFYFNGAGFINKKRTHLCLYDLKEHKLEDITPEKMDVSCMALHEDKLYFAGLEFERNRKLNYEGLYMYDLTDLTLQTLVEPGMLSIQSIAWVNDRLLVIGSEGKAYGLNENPWFFAWKPETGLEKEMEADLAMSNTTGTDCRLVGGNAFAVYDNLYYFLATIAENVQLFVYDGHTIKQVFQWKGSIDAFSISKESIHFIGARPAGLQQLFVWKEGKTEQLSDFNPQIKEQYVALPQSITYKGYDGQMLEGWILYPRNFDPQGVYPGILDIHGGPKTVYSTIFYHEMQVWASQGYFVFFTNPHGSDGFGNAFADIRGKYGTIDYEDLMAFTDAVLEAVPQINPEALGVTGGSYGGFMTNWIIGHTQRFQAAASQRSISNWISFTGTSDIGTGFTQDQQAANMYTGLDKLWFHSPLKYAGSVTTPTLFIHSDEDYRCPLEQGMQMLSALLARDIEARMCLFHGENHELSRSGKPQHRIRRLKEITEWMNGHLSK